MSYRDLLRLSGLLMSWSTASEQSEGAAQPQATGHELSSQTEEDRGMKKEILGEWPESTMALLAC